MGFWRGNNNFPKYSLFFFDKILKPTHYYRQSKRGISDKGPRSVRIHYGKLNIYNAHPPPVISIQLFIANTNATRVEGGPFLTTGMSTSRA